ncbi:aromatic acid exporter family protein [Paenibacillus antri]|uniref:Aromatic acid exporter family protein n=1 Tax=Paenibacillus antri TaxID=2582848 RepID=A0A5R9G5N4_9BACL|nr:aromatic acid exporter family protein [Paenibacillus antri]TLS48264.1 aromatic acid exporter family protein [Paenibacillus antri]
MRIGFRTLKTAVGVSLAIAIAYALQLEFYTSAGILTLLCIQKTRRESLAAVLERLYACLIGMALAGASFWAIGFQPWTILPLFLVFIPITVRLRVQGGIASSSVIMMHLYVHGSIDAALLLNELAIIAIGLGVALVVNVYMPGIDKQVQRYKEDIDRLMAVVLEEYAKYMKDGYGLWDGKEMLELSDVLSKARNLAILEVENNLTRRSNPFYHYFDRKQQQFQILERMLPMVSRMDIRLEQGIRLGEFIESISASLRHPAPDDFVRHADKLRSIRELHKGLPMPETRTEFENRAILYGLANELESFIRKG